ncbi:PH domain-containing protein [Ruminococcaceae bacterium OttesenSCG-928-N02]|nr:PH domain-containing protein [Ruminococcaceae bacterium OttesenSCG-928-N02]
MQQFYISKKGAFITALLPALILSVVSGLIRAIFLGFHLRWTVLTTTGIFVCLGVFSQVRRIGYVITLEAGTLHMHRGFVFISVHQVRLENILSLTIMQTPAHAIFNLCWMKVNTVGGSFWVGGLALEDAQTLQKELQKAGACT